MTTKAYRKDLRIRVIEKKKIGMKEKKVGELFGVSINEVNRWWLRYKKEGSIVSKSRGGSKWKLDPLKLEEYVKLNPNQRLKEIGKAFGVSDWANYKRLKALGFRYKKKTINIWKLAKKEEECI